MNAARRALSYLASFAGLLAAWIPAVEATEVPTPFVELSGGRYAFPSSMKLDGGELSLRFGHGEIRVPVEQVVTLIGIEPEPEGFALEPSERERVERGEVRLLGRWVPAEDLRPGHREKRNWDTEALDRERLRWENRRSKKTRFFYFEYTIDDDRLADYADYMERFLKFVCKEVGSRPPRNKRYQILFFHDESTRAHVVSSDINYNVKYFHYSDEPLARNRTLLEINRDLTAYALDLIDPKWKHPAWLIDGMSAYFAHAQWDGSGRRFVHGQLDPAALLDLQDDLLRDRTQSIRDILRSDYDLFLSPVQKPWVWSLTWFLLTHDRYAKGFRRYARDLLDHPKVRRGGLSLDADDITPESQAEILEQKLGASIEKVEREWHDEIVRLVKDPKGRSELLAVADALRHRGQFEKATRLYEQVLDPDAGEADPDVGIGLLECLVSMGEHRRATELADRLLDTDPLNALVHYWRAQLILQDDLTEGRRLLALTAELAVAEPEVAYAAHQRFFESLVARGE